MTNLFPTLGVYIHIGQNRLIIYLQSVLKRSNQMKDYSTFNGLHVRRSNYFPRQTICPQT